MKPIKPIRLDPSLREKVWGTTNLEPWFPRSQAKMGEVWFDPEPPLPILVKFIFTEQKLSVQVHPDDEYGHKHGGAGKTEMWYILRAEPGASIAVGFRKEISREHLREAAISGEIEDLLHWYPVKAGDTFFTPAGTVHAIGGGLALCEIQQHSDTTYRLYDYGRPRELHLENGIVVADLGKHPGPSVPEEIEPGRRLLARCPYFATEIFHLDAPTAWSGEPERFHLLIFTKGHGTIGGAAFREGEVWMVPAGTPGFTLKPDKSVHLLRTCVPR